jgi:hypothetical protein
VTRTGELLLVLLLLCFALAGAPVAAPDGWLLLLLTGLVARFSFDVGCAGDF